MEISGIVFNPDFLQPLFCWSFIFIFFFNIVFMNFKLASLVATSPEKKNTRKFLAGRCENRIILFGQNLCIYIGLLIILNHFYNTHVLMNSMVCTLSWSALCRSASMRISAALSIDRLLHRASSHMTFSLSNAYCKITPQNYKYA